MDHKSDHVYWSFVRKMDHNLTIFMDHNLTIFAIHGPQSDHFRDISVNFADIFVDRNGPQSDHVKSQIYINGPQSDQKYKISLYT